QVLNSLDLPAVKKGNANITLLDANGKVLNVYPFDVSFTDVEGEQIDSAKFFVQIPFDQQISKMVLNFQGKSITTITNPNKLPAVIVDTPTASEVWEGLREVKWTSSNADSFTLLYSPDNGQQIWEPVASGIKGNSFLVDTSSLTPSKLGKFRILATNGFNTSEADSATFTVNNSPPNVDILAPLSSDITFSVGDLLPFKGRAVDPEDGILPDNHTYWKYDDTPFATGTDILSILPEGTHVITFGAEDSHGAIAEKNITIKVVKNDQTTTTEEFSSKLSSTSQGVQTSPGFDFYTVFLVSVLVICTITYKKRRNS
ncbi:MAG: hypothetical protein ACFFD1_16020, partial [Candidatus Thorarchaeota archaeon]